MKFSSGTELLCKYWPNFQFLFIPHCIGRSVWLYITIWISQSAKYICIYIYTGWFFLQNYYLFHPIPIAKPFIIVYRATCTRINRNLFLASVPPPSETLRLHPSTPRLAQTRARINLHLHVCVCIYTYRIYYVYIIYILYYVFIVVWAENSVFIIIISN